MFWGQREWGWEMWKKHVEAKRNRVYPHHLHATVFVLASVLCSAFEISPGNDVIALHVVIYYSLLCLALLLFLMTTSPAQN